jgi:hypothetical protein
MISDELFRRIVVATVIEMVTDADHIREGVPPFGVNITSEALVLATVGTAYLLHAATLLQ